MLSRWAENVLSAPYTGGVPTLYKLQVRLGSEAIRTFGADAAAVFSEWMAQIGNNSPRLKASTLRQLQRPDCFERIAQYVSKHGVRSRWTPFSRPLYISGIYVNVGKPGWRAYAAMTTYVQIEGLNPHAFAMDYGRLRDLIGYGDKGDARKAAIQAEQYRILFRLHRGSARTKGRGGQPTLFCLRGANETMEEAIAAGRKSDAYVARSKVEPNAA
ncbi:MAG TPA: hypothetical protein VIW73_08790 [Candidatus Cybelea sp.]